MSGSPYDGGPDRQQYEPYGAMPGGPYGPPPPYGGPQLYPQPKQTNGLAIASMVVSIISAVGVLAACGVGGVLGLVGAIMGHVAMSQNRRNGQDGDGFAIAGIVVGWISFVLAMVAIAVIVAFLVAVGHVDTPYGDTGTDA